LKENKKESYIVESQFWNGENMNKNTCKSQITLLINHEKGQNKVVLGIKFEGKIESFYQI